MAAHARHANSPRPGARLAWPRALAALLAASCQAAPASEVSAPAPAPAAAVPLAATSLYTERVSRCRAADQDAWSGEALAALKDGGASVQRVELCNGDDYPVVTASFASDPRAKPSEPFDRLYARIAQATGYKPFSIVVVNVGVGAQRVLEVRYEAFSPQTAS